MIDWISICFAQCIVPPCSMMLVMEAIPFYVIVVAKVMVLKRRILYKALLLLPAQRMDSSVRYDACFSYLIEP